MSRFFVPDSDSEVEDEHSEEETPQDEIEDTKPAQKTFQSQPSTRIKEPKKFMSQKSKRFTILHENLDEILNQFELGDYKKATEAFKKLQNNYTNSKKVIDKEGLPNFFLRDMVEINEKVNQLAKNEKELKRMVQDLKSFNKNFEKELNDFTEHPENYQNDDGDLLDDSEGEEDMEPVSESSSDGGGWFLDDDDDTKVKESQKKDKKDQKGKTQRQNTKTQAELVAERLNALQAAKIDNETATKELADYAASRQKGKIIVQVSRLHELYNAIKDPEISHQIKLEICFTVEEGPSDQAIPLEDWTFILDFISTLTEDAPLLVPLLERLNRDFWARSVDPQLLFTPEVSRLHEILPRFIQVMQTFSVVLRKKDEFALCARLENLLIEHIYHKETEDVMPHTLSILELLDHKIFDDATTLNFRARAAIFLAINLAVRKHPSEAEDVFKRIPQIPSEFVQTQILYNRATAQIAIAAFYQGRYRSAYLFLRRFYNVKFMAKNLGQDPSIYPPWLMIDTKIITILHLLSAMLLDLPYLTVPIKDESKLLIKGQMHKELQKENLTSHPETSSQRVAVAIGLAKAGNWKEAYDTISSQLGSRHPNLDKFVTDLKKISLCCFLLKAKKYYDSIKYDYLVKKFELSKEEILEITKKMIEGFSPIENAQIEFDGSISESQEYIIFDHQEVESPFASYGEIIQVKTKALKDALENLQKK